VGKRRAVAPPSVQAQRGRRRQWLEERLESVQIIVPVRIALPVIHLLFLLTVFRLVRIFLTVFVHRTYHVFLSWPHHRCALARIDRSLRTCRTYRLRLHRHRLSLPHHMLPEGACTLARPLVRSRLHHRQCREAARERSGRHWGRGEVEVRCCCGGVGHVSLVGVGHRVDVVLVVAL